MKWRCGMIGPIGARWRPSGPPKKSRMAQMSRFSGARRGAGWFCGFALLVTIFVCSVFAPGICAPAAGQLLPGGEQNRISEPGANPAQTAEAELQTGTALTRQGKFKEAIPHLLKAHGHVTEEYAAGFNLALCYVGTSQFKKAAEVLTDLRDSGSDNAMVEDLLAQAYVGTSQKDEALAALKKSVAQQPDNEKLYLYVTDACMEQGEYSLGLSVADLGLQQLPKSAALHFERGSFLIRLDRLDLAKGELELASQLAPGTDIAYMAISNKDLVEGDISEAIRVGREAVANGEANYVVLQVLGEALLRAGANPGQPEFAEAQAALEKSVTERPSYSSAQVTLGKIYLMQGRLDDAIAHLEAARALNPRNTSVYSHLAAAYRRKGEIQQSQAMLAILARLNQDEVERIRTEPGETKGSYVGSGDERSGTKIAH